MKILKIAGIALAIIAVILIVLGLVGPKTYNVQRSITINAPAETIFQTVSHYENFSKWSPWQHLDPEMKTTIDGADGTVGAKYSWVGNSKAGEGSMTFTKLEPNKTIEQDLAFVKPFKSESQTYMDLEPADGRTKVTWGMKGESAFVSRIMMTLMGGMDKMIGPDYEKGLANLKTLSEAAGSPVSTTTYEVKEVDWAEKNCISTKRQIVTAKEFDQFFGTNLGAISKAIEGAGARAGSPLGIYYSFDEVAMKADMVAAVPYEGKKVSAKGFETINLPAGKAYVVDYYGDYMKMKSAYDAMHNKLKEAGKDKDPVFIEEYLSDPMVEKDTAKWHTKLYYILK